MANTIATMLRESLQHAHEIFEGTMQGVTDEVAHWQPAGKALPIGAAYAHAVISEDLLVSGMATKEKPVLEKGWAQRMGLSTPHPAMDADWEKNFADWSKTVKIDLPKLQAYAKEVYRETDDYLATLTDKDLAEKKIDFSSWGMGEKPVTWFIIRILIGHIDNLAGEISAVKGLQGLKGYPF